MTQPTTTQRAMIAARQQRSQYIVSLSGQETESRGGNITVTIQSYDATTGDWLATTPDGGQIRVRSNSNGSLAGQTLPLQRFAGSQIATVDTKPTTADQGALLGQVESYGQQLYKNLYPVQSSDGDPNDNGLVGRFSNNQSDLAVDTEAEALYRWDPADEQWNPVGSAGGVIYGDGDPNMAAVPWEANAIYHDTTLLRSYLAGETVQAWVPLAPYSFDSTTAGQATAVYRGDLYQASDGAFYRMDSNGDWVVQWYCPDCEEEPDDPPPVTCSLGYDTSAEAIAANGGFGLWNVVCA